MISKNKKKLIKSKNIPLVSDKKRHKEEIEEVYINPLDMFSMFNEKDDKELDDRGILIIDNEISKISLAKISRRILTLHFDESFTDKIQIIINSPGGYCDAGWALIDLMSFIKNPIKTIAMGEICSMAAYIFISGDERIMSPNCDTMIHQFSDYGEGNYGDLVAKSKSWKMEMDKSTAHLIKYSKYNTKAQIEKNLLIGHDNWLSSEEMMKHGLCDTIFKPKPRGKK